MVCQLYRALARAYLRHRGIELGRTARMLPTRGRPVLRIVSTSDERRGMTQDASASERRFGNWVFTPRNATLRNFVTDFAVDLDNMRTSAALLWVLCETQRVVQEGKYHVADADLVGLMQACLTLLDPQELLCPDREENDHGVSLTSFPFERPGPGVRGDDA